MKRSLALCAIAIVTVTAGLIAGPVRQPMPGKTVWYFGTPRSYKPAISALHHDEPVIALLPVQAAVVPPSAPVHATQPAWLLLAAAMCIALAGTAGLLIAVRTVMRKSAPPAARPVPVSPIVMREPMKPEVPTAYVPTMLPEMDAEEVSDDEEDVLRVAQQYQRGRGEVELAMRMRTQQKSPVTVPEKIRRAGSAGSVSKNIALAKKLGVGKGEIALAVRLHNVRTSTVHVKEAV